MLPPFIIGAKAKMCPQLIRTTTNSTKKTFKRHKRDYFGKNASQTLQIPKLMIPKDTNLVSKQMIQPFYIGTNAKKRLQTKNVCRKFHVQHKINFCFNTKKFHVRGAVFRSNTFPVLSV